MNDSYEDYSPTNQCMTKVVRKTLVKVSYKDKKSCVTPIYNSNSSYFGANQTLNGNNRV